MQKSFRVATIFIAASAIAATAGCFLRQEEAPPPVRLVTSASYSPHDSICGPIARQMIREGAGFKDTLPVDVMSWASWDIPEFQDQQRLVAGKPSSNRYGPLACVVARPHLETIPLSDFDLPQGVLVAVTWVRFDDRPAHASYARLRIDKKDIRFNCVFIRRRPQSAGISGPRLEPIQITPAGGTVTGADDRWQGYVVPSISRKCAIDDGSTPLVGYRISMQGMTGNLVPAVARFMVDKNWRAGIGVRCGDAWCTLGYRFIDHAIPAHGAVSTGTAAEMSRKLIPGWFDDQQIALPGSDGPLPIRARLHASIVPHVNLDTYTYADFDAGWKPVATVTFRNKPVGKYVNEWGFLPNLGMPNLLELRRIDSAGVRVWRARVNMNDEFMFRVIHTPHTVTGFHTVGTARWAWSDRDEPIWVRCDEGCCWIEPM